MREYKERKGDQNKDETVLIMVSEAEYSALDERDLDRRSDQNILGLLIIQEEKYLLI